MSLTFVNVALDRCIHKHIDTRMSAFTVEHAHLEWIISLRLCACTTSTHTPCQDCVHAHTSTHACTQKHEPCQDCTRTQARTHTQAHAMPRLRAQSFLTFSSPCLCILWLTGLCLPSQCDKTFSKHFHNHHIMCITTYTQFHWVRLCKQPTNSRSDL